MVGVASGAVLVVEGASTGTSGQRTEGPLIERVVKPVVADVAGQLGDVEYITADYIAWYNQQRLMHRLGRIPPAEAEARYYSQRVTDQPAGSQTPRMHETRDGSFTS